MSGAKRSAGLLLYRLRGGRVEVLIAHMGGPFWAKKDDGAWSIIKGELGDGEDAYAAARREFEEETGIAPPQGRALELGEVRQSSGKLVTAWAIAGELDPSQLRSNTFAIEWPRGSGERREFPEIDRVEWFDAGRAARKLVKGQAALIEALERRLDEENTGPATGPEAGAEC